MIHSAKGVVGNTANAPTDPGHKSLEETKKECDSHCMMKSHFVYNGTATD